MFLGVPSSQCVGLLGSERGVMEAREGEIGKKETSQDINTPCSVSVRTKGIGTYIGGVLF